MTSETVKAGWNYNMFRDDYPTCKETYATLRIYREELDPSELSERLNVSPSSSQRRGQQLPTKTTARIGGWFLSSRGLVESRDVQRHISWVLDRLSGRHDVIWELQREGYDMDIFCYWVSAHGHGGPELTHEVMQQLASLKLKVGFDIYC